ncbi:TetR/AcrR family transcriptional regulator [Streptomyces sp. NPDC020799]|uniref:TetR/AcrR family transcriptional regulator n=1 Tax=Streptomyces sp. NPDC020799 TaxID=3365091 RepID=UPI003789FC91
MENVSCGLVRPPGRRERNKQKVRRRLYSSALTLFAEQGYEHTSIDEIAELADVARGTFFNYFHRKEDLIGEWGRERRALLRERLDASAPTGGHEGTEAQLRRCMTALADINEEERATTIAMLMAWVKAGRPLLEEPYACEVFTEIIEAGVAHGELGPGISPPQVGNFVRDAYQGVLYRWAHAGGTGVSLHAELESVLQILLHGIVGPGRPAGAYAYDAYRVQVPHGLA